MTTKTGRPANYSHEDLARAVAQAEEQFGAPTPAQVKAKLCEQLGIPASINEGTFQAALAQYHEDRRQMRERALIAGLPAGIRNKATAQVTGPLQHAIMLMLGESYAPLQEETDQRIAEAEHRTRDVAFKLRHLEADLTEKDAALAAMTAEKDEALTRIAVLQDEVAILKQRVATQASEEQAENRMLESLGRIFSEITATPELKAQVTALLYRLPSRSDDAA